eukprot:10926949-Alexandrium_andersonii.AAC.1
MAALHAMLLPARISVVSDSKSMLCRLQKLIDIRGAAPQHAGVDTELHMRAPWSDVPVNPNSTDADLWTLIARA